MMFPRHHYGFNPWSGVHGVLMTSTVEIAQGIDDQTHWKPIDFKTYVLSECDALRVFNEMASSDGVWNKVLPNIDDHNSLWHELVQGGECMGSRETMMGCPLHSTSPSDLILGDGHIMLQLPGSAMCPTHQTFAGMTCQMSDYWVLHTIPHTDGLITDKDGEERKGMPLLRGWPTVLIPRYLRKCTIRTLYGMSTCHGSAVSAISNI